MDKYIKSDIATATIYMKAAICNALHDIDLGEETEIDLGSYISWNLFNECLETLNWKKDELREWEPNGWQVDFWYYCYSPSGKYCVISGSLWKGQSYKIKVI